MTSSPKNPPVSHAPLSVLQLSCPQCGKEARVIQIPESIPLFGQILLQTIVCRSCGFKYSDVMSLEFNEPKGFVATIENEDDLRTKIVRNSSGTIEIPELGVLLEPGPTAEGFYTNMEGLLVRVEGVVQMLARSQTGKEKTNAQKLLEKIEKCKKGKFVFTVRVLDPFGASALIGRNVTSFSLSKEEVKSLKKGTIVLQSPKKG